MHPQAMEEKSYWIKHVDAYKRGNFASKAAYCAKFGVCYHRFLYWCQKIVKELVKKGDLSREALFMPIKVVPQESPVTSPTSLLCTLEFKQGHKLIIHNESVLEKLVNLLSE